MLKDLEINMFYKRSHKLLATFMSINIKNKTVKRLTSFKSESSSDAPPHVQR